MQKLLIVHEYNLYENIGVLKETLLHLACRNGQLDIVRSLVEVYGCRLDLPDKFGCTPCHVACENGQVEIMEYFYQCPYSLECSLKNHCGETWLHSTSKTSKSSSVQLIRLITFNHITIASKGHIKLVDFNDDILLYYFYKNNFMKFSNTFDEIFVTDRNGYTPLHVACKKNNLEVIKLYLSELNLVLNFNFLQYIPSLLAYACELRQFDIIDYLSSFHYKSLLPCPHVQSSVVYKTLFKEKDLHFPNEIPLFFAARRGDYQLFKHFSKSLCTFAITNGNGDTLLHAACVSNDTDMVSFFSQEVILNNIDIMAKNKRGNTCLHIACEWGSQNFVDYLIKKKVSIDDRNSEEETPLHLAIRNKRRSIFNVLLENNADLSATNIHGETPLHIATCDPEGMYYVERLFAFEGLNYGSINVKDKNGDMPLFNACRTKNKVIFT